VDAHSPFLVQLQLFYTVYTVNNSKHMHTIHESRHCLLCVYRLCLTTWRKHSSCGCTATPSPTATTILYYTNLIYSFMMNVARRTPRPCSVCGSPRLCRRRERRLFGARFGRWREERFGRARCLTLRYSLLLSVWVDPSVEHMLVFGVCVQVVFNNRTETFVMWMHAASF